MKSEKEIKKRIEHIKEDFPNIDDAESYDDGRRYVRGIFDALKWVLKNS